MEECPCKNCPCVAICRLKSFSDMTKDCVLVLHTLYYDKTTYDGARSENFYPKLIEIYTILNPDSWKVEKEGDRLTVICPEEDCLE